MLSILSSPSLFLSEGFVRLWTHRNLHKTNYKGDQIRRKSMAVYLRYMTIHSHRVQICMRKELIYWENYLISLYCNDWTRWQVIEYIWGLLKLTKLHFSFNDTMNLLRTLFLFKKSTPSIVGTILTNLRSATRGDLLIPFTRTKLGERSFRISAPTVWNSLPYSLKHSATSREHFRKELKTYPFKKAYAPAYMRTIEEWTYLLTNY